MFKLGLIAVALLLSVSGLSYNINAINKQANCTCLKNLTFEDMMNTSLEKITGNA